MTDAPTITVITDRDIAELCANIYTAQSPGEWEQLELPPDGIAFGIKDLGPATALIFRGTKTLPDWLRDLEAFADPDEHADLGPVHPGFFEGPRPGFPQAGSIIAEVRGRSYRNGNGRAHDLVTDVPFTTWIEDYVHPTALVPVCWPPTDDDVQRDALFAWHSFTLYALAVPDNPIAIGA